MSEIKTNKISPRKGTTQTIGDSGDSVTIASGTTTTNAGTITTAGISGGTINNTSGTIPGLAGVVDWDTTPKTSGFTAVSNKGYFCNTTSAAFTVTFPASPTAGDVVALKDYANTFDTNNLTINPNGNKFDGGTGNGIILIEGANSQFIYVDATRGWVLTDASKASDIAENATFISATGGTITTCGDYKIHTFTGPGTFCVASVGNCAGGGDKADYLVIAAGGGGGSGGCWSGVEGGAGAGGYRESHVAATSGCYTASPLASSTSLTLTAQGYPITVGAGGTGGVPAGSSGGNSVFSTITSTGGGGGGAGRFSGSNFYAGQPGGSGGGGGGRQSGGATTAGTGNTPPVSPPQGSNGGTGQGSWPGQLGGGGGGGATGTGAGAGGGESGGSGGAGTTTSINGTATVRASGGSGAGNSTGLAPATPGGGGGTGSGNSPIAAGTANTGGGAGAGQTGGSGIVIIRYKYQ
jgi:hypothetical protein